MKTKTKKILAALFLCFIALFVIRLILGFFIEFHRLSDINLNSELRMPIFSSMSDIAYEKAVSNNVKQMDSGREQVFQGTGINQLEVFAKEAKVNTVSQDYDNDEKKIYALLKKQKSVIRIEQKYGLKPNRTLRLVIKVPEDKFDVTVKELQKIGKLNSINISKEDKTEQVKNLFIKKQSLEEYKKSLAKLREQENGKVEEFIKLEDKIQKIEKDIQALGVQFGDFVREESYSNVSFSLIEHSKSIVNEEKYPIMARVFDAFAWTVKWYFIFVVAMTTLCMTSYSVNLLKGKSE